MKQHQNKLRFQKQYDLTDCGPACLTMIARSFGVKTDLPWMREATGTNGEGSSFYGLLQAAERMHLAPEAYHLSADQLSQAELPCIAHLGDHFVVVTKVKNNLVRIADPAIGHHEIPLDEFCERWSGYIMCFSPKEDALDLQSGRHQSAVGPYQLVVDLLRRYRWVWLGLLFVSLAYTVLSLVIPLVNERLIDSLADQNFNAPTQILAGASCVAMTIVLLGFVRRFLTLWMARKLAVLLSFGILERLLAMPLTFFMRRKSTDLIMRLTDVEVLKDFFSGRGVEFIFNGALLAVYLLYLSWVEWRLAIAHTIVASLFFLLSIKLSSRMQMYLAAELKYDSDAHSRALESVQNVALFKTHRAEKFILDKWQRSFIEADKFNFKRQATQNVLSTIGEALVILVPFAVLFLGVQGVEDKSMTIGQLVMLASLSAMIMSPLMSISSIFSELANLKVSLERINDIQATATEDSGAPLQSEAGEAKIAPLSEITLEIEQLSYRYNLDDLKDACSDVNLSLSRGQSLVIYGPSGCGKSTLMKVLAGLLPIEAGGIKWFGRSLKDYSQQQLRQLISIVLQEPLMVRASVAENICLDQPFLQERLDKVAQVCCLTDFIYDLPGGFDYTLQEGGAGLSGGQLQRLGLARALYREPKILLLDEATSALDQANSQKIISNLLELKEEIAVVLVTHDPALVARFDVKYNFAAETADN